MNTPRWYMLDKDGMATLCASKTDAKKEARAMDMAWPHMGPHRAVQLVEAADVEALRAGYAAARLEIESLRARSVAHAGEYPALPEIKDMHNGPQQLNLSDRAMWVLGWNECRDAARDADRGMRAAQQESFDHGPQATSIEEAARDVGKWLNERPNRPLDLRHVAMLCAHAKAAHQQEAQEPVAWRVHPFDYGVGSEGVYAMTALTQQRDVWERRGWKTEPLYTAPAQPSPASQGDALDAARYAIVRRGQHWSVIDGLGDPLTGDRLDAAVDAVCAAREGKK